MRAASTTERSATLLALVFVLNANAQDLTESTTSLACQAALHALSSVPADTALAAAGHVPPPAPAHAMGAMSATQMVDVMGMDDKAMFGLFALDRLERSETDDGHALSWNLQGWLGGDFDKFALRSEGVRESGQSAQADIELLWSHAIAPFWDSKLGVRHDFGRGPDRSWVTFGAQGLAPYGFEISATVYAGEQRRSALRLEAGYELLLSQRLVLQPRFELNAYGRNDPATHVGAGLADTELGMRLRYEIRREFAPYIGIERRHDFGASADFARADGRGVADTQWLAGVRIWF